MNVLLIDNGDEELTYISNELVSMGHTYHLEKTDLYALHPFDGMWKKNSLDKLDIEEYDLVLSTDFYPELASLCNQKKKVYLAWVLHLPCVALYSKEVIYPTNRIFCPDMDQVQLFQSSGIDTVFYLPYAVNVPEEKENKRKNKVSIITNFNNAIERGVYATLGRCMDSTKGYLDGIAAAQSNIYPNYILDKLPAYVMEDVIRNIAIDIDESNMATPDWIIREYLVSEMMTARDRLVLTAEMSGCTKISLFTDSNVTDGTIKRKPRPKSIQEEVKVYSESGIAIAIPRRAYHNAIYKDTLKIMAAGALAITPYTEEQAELLQSNGVVALYTEAKECGKIVDYYLKHEDERQEMATKGRELVKNEFSYRNRLADIMSVI